jgi:hypothetical protein
VKSGGQVVLRAKRPDLRHRLLLELNATLRENSWMLTRKVSTAPKNSQSGVQAGKAMGAGGDQVEFIGPFAELQSADFGVGGVVTIHTVWRPKDPC